MRPGWKTTEFWGRAIVTAMGLAIGSGAVDPQLGQSVTDAANQALPIVQAIIDGIVKLAGIIVAFALQWRQGKERAQLKTEELSTQRQP